MSEWRVDNPLTEALRAITGAEPPTYTHGAFSCDDLPDCAVFHLQDWCSLHARPDWATGLGVLEAADLIVQLAVENANIPGPVRGGER